MTTPTDAVEQAAQALLDAPREALDSIRMTRESAENYAAMLRALLRERDEFRTMANQMAAAQMAVNSMKSNARATALEEAADEAKRMQNRYLRDSYQGPADACGSLERKLRTLSAQARAA